MRNLRIVGLAVGVGLSIQLIAAAHAGPNSKLALTYYTSGHAYDEKGDYDRAIAALDKAIELNPNYAAAYNDRGYAYAGKGDYDRGIADYDKAIELSPQDAAGYANRGAAYNTKGDYDRALVDLDKAIELDPKTAAIYNDRGYSYAHKADYDHALADLDKAIELDPKIAAVYKNRGYVYDQKGDYDRALIALDKAIELNPRYVDAYEERGNAYDGKNDPAKALADFRTAAQLMPGSDRRHDRLSSRVAELEKRLAGGATASLEKPLTASDTASLEKPLTSSGAASLGRRVALVIGNSAYGGVGELANPQRDADAIASALRSDGFEVTEVANLKRVDFIAALNQFSDVAENADWATIYFAGHGLQLEGVNYLVPIDARLRADRDVQDEAIALDRVIGAVGHVHKFGLVIVDACRNNPFLAAMHFTTGARSARVRGLARVEIEGTTLVEFAARDGQEALDGDANGNSPFAAALARRLTKPGVEVGKLLRQVREDVLAATANQQDPMFTGDIPAEDLYFRPPQP